MENTNNNNGIKRRFIKRDAVCPICNTTFRGDAVVIPIVRGKRVYIHAGCEKDALTGAALFPFNTHGGSVNTFKVVVHTHGTNADERVARAMYLRSVGFDVKSGSYLIRGEATVPAQSISKVLRTVYQTCKAVDIDGAKFKTLDEALKYVRSVTHGNSHNNG